MANTEKKTNIFSLIRIAMAAVAAARFFYRTVMAAVAAPNKSDMANTEKNPTAIAAAAAPNNSDMANSEKNRTAMVAVSNSDTAIKLKNSTKFQDENMSIPADVVDEILSRLPVKYLIRFQTLSKSYRSKISDPWFSKFSYNNQWTKSHNLFLYQVREGEERWCERFALVRLEGKCFKTEVELGVPFGPVMPLCCCNGIVLLIFKEPSKGLVLWNPSIRRHTMIPNPPDLISWPGLDPKFQFGLYHDSRMDDYKIVIITRKFSLTFSCKTTTWAMEEPSPLSELGVLMDGCFYDWCPKKIEYFDLSEGKFGKLKWPNMNVNPTDQVILCPVRGRLCVYWLSGDGRKLKGWVMQKEAQGESWTELKNMERRGPHFSLPGRISISIDLFSCNSRFIIYNHLEKRYQHNSIFSGVRSTDLVPYSEGLFFPS